MKVIVIAFAMLLAGANTLPSKLENPVTAIESAIRAEDRRLVTGQIVDAIEAAAQAIRDAGLDPLHIDRVSLDYALPVPTIFNMRSRLESFLFRGLGNIVINRMNYNAVSSRLTFNIELPQIFTSIGIADYDVKLFDSRFHGRIGGGVSINKIVITGDIRVSIGLLSGISIRSLAMTMRLGSIDSHLSIECQGVSISSVVNNYLSKTIPGTLNKFQKDIDDLITILARDVVEQNL